MMARPAALRLIVLALAGCGLATLPGVAAAVPATPPYERSGEAAADVVRSLYAAINRRDMRAAYSIWHGRSDYRHFVAGYADTRHARVKTIGPYETEGGAGSIYCTVNVQVIADQSDGSHRRYVGSYSLRRVNDIDGSTAAQRRWHIFDAMLRRVG